MKTKNELFPLYTIFIITSFLCVVIGLITVNLPAILGWGTSLMWFYRAEGDVFEEYTEYIHSKVESIKDWWES